ncbi:hypothetical protein F5Y07DRAFT_405828 [Xylaria sp. FL0933]|nr:hypothetical protein F5Y07DRAFT_405828 [Xylaria sp. FL0933]
MVDFNDTLPLVTQARIAFLQHDEAHAHEKPYLYLLPKHDELPLSNCQFSSHLEVPLLDCRDTMHEDDFSTNGFAFIFSELKHLHLEAAAHQDEPTQELLDHLQHMRQFTAHHLGCDRVIVFDWRFRKASRRDQVDDFDEDPISRGSLIRPAYKAHADLSPAGGWITLKEYLSKDDYSSIAAGKKRAMIVTCWRPLVPVVTDCPLAFCIRGTTEDVDCVSFDRVDGTNSGGEGMFLKYNHRQQWRWLSEQTCNEVSLFQSWDSTQRGLEGHIFHAAFWHPESTNEGRLSIEIRLIAVFDLSE